ncbi:hypothetical protein JCM10213_006949 [Rhodosporidiobolus nylandii]
MTTNPLDPESYTHRSVSVPSGTSYHLIDQAPTPSQGQVKDAPTVLLLHGFPDLWWGWRYQIAAFSARGYRVVCPTQLGYGETSRPGDLARYSWKSVAFDMNAVLDVVGAGKVFVIGHDWGGQIAWRFTEYFPERVLAVASVCTPYLPPPAASAPFISLEELVRTKLPNFGYQIFFASDRSAPKFDQVLDHVVSSMFSPVVRQKKLAAGEDVSAMPNKVGEYEKYLDAMIAKKEKGTLPELPNDPESRYYVETFRKTGLKHALNWYRTRKLNYKQDQADRLAEKGFPPHIPALLLPAEKDVALPPAMSKSEAVLKAFERGGNLRIEVIEGADHWLLQDQRFRDQVTNKLDAFMQEVASGKWLPAKGAKM